MLSIDDALAAAEDARQDLVEVSPQANPPVCRLQDYNKAKYAAKLREKVGCLPTSSRLFHRAVICRQTLEACSFFDSAKPQQGVMSDLCGALSATRPGVGMKSSLMASGKCALDFYGLCCSRARVHAAERYAACAGRS